MKTTEIRPEYLLKLRQQAEALLGAIPADSSRITQAEGRRVLHELHTFQIELELQNEELRHTQKDLAQAHDRYLDLYDFAPMGYLTIGDKGLIEEANLTVTAMLGLERSRLLNRPLSSFVVVADRDILYRHRQLLLDTRQRQSYRLRLERGDGSWFWGQLESILAASGKGNAPLIRTAVSDITEQKQTEDELLHYRQELENLVVERTTELHQSNQKLEATVAELQKALEEISTLRGIVPICASCKGIRDQDGNWQKLEKYIQTHSEATFSHLICPACAEKLYPELDLYKKK